MMIFPSLFDEKCETKKALFDCPNEKDKKRRACFLFPSSISSISASLVLTYVEERFGTL